jgi:hypothetical protein
MNKKTLTEELASFDLKTLGEILEKLNGTYNKLKTQEEKEANNINYSKNNELTRVQNGSRRSFFISEYLNESNVEFVRLLDKNFFSMKDKIQKKAEKFRNNDKNIEKYQLNHKKEKMRRLSEYMEEAYPTIQGDLWEVELEIKLITKAINLKLENN